MSSLVLVEAVYLNKELIFKEWKRLKNWPKISPKISATLIVVAHDDFNELVELLVSAPINVLAPSKR